MHRPSYAAGHDMILEDDNIRQWVAPHLILRNGLYYWHVSPWRCILHLTILLLQAIIRIDQKFKNADIRV